MARPVTSYRALDLGAGAWEIGLLTGAFALLPMLVALPLGRLADRWRPEPILTGGVVLLVAGCLLMAASTSLAGVGLAEVVLGLGNLGCTMGGENLVARLEPQGLDRGFGLFTAVVSAGQLVGRGRRPPDRGRGPAADPPNGCPRPAVGSCAGRGAPIPLRSETEES